MLRAESLRKVFYPPRGAAVAAVKGATFTVEPGEVFGLLGPNGAGKTTLLRMLGTIISPTSGHCWVGDVRTDTAKDDIRKDIGFLSGNTKLYGRLTASEVLFYFGRLYSMEDSAIQHRIDELAEMLDMGAFLDRRCEALSTGQTQKVSIARVILHDPKVLILDEPTLGLDIMTSRSILDFILHAKERGHSIIFSTHYMTEAELLCDRVGLIYQGDLLAVGTKEELYAQAGSSNLQQTFLNLVGDEAGTAQ
jgi:sodium transport system ATP-binding protein